VPHRHDLGAARLPIEYDDRLIASHGAQVLAQSRLEFCNSYRFHGLSVTRSAHLGSLLLPNSRLRRAATTDRQDRQARCFTVEPNGYREVLANHSPGFF
jgi:hypothetical protein